MTCGGAADGGVEAADDPDRELLRCLLIGDGRGLRAASPAAKRRSTGGGGFKAGVGAKSCEPLHSTRRRMLSEGIGILEYISQDSATDCGGAREKTVAWREGEAIHSLTCLL